MISDAINLGDLYAARQRIAGIVRRTPLVPAEALSPLAGTAVHYKLEILQATGAFKTRGAANKILSLPDAVRARGVTTVSTGNHGRAVAHVARSAGCRAVVCLSELVPENKKAAIRALGAEVRVHGRSQDEAAEIAFALERDEGMTLINPFDDPSGGGLIGGIAVAIKAANPWARVIGVSMDRGAAMYESQKAGKPILVEEVESLADSLGGGIFLDNKWTFGLVRDLVDDLVLVTEEEIARAMAFLLDRDHFVVEGGGAVGVAALLAGKVGPGRLARYAGIGEANR
jgi:threonine dehydratase